MRDHRPIQPAFKKVLAYFESKSDFARQIEASNRQAVDYWVRIGYIPAKWAAAASMATGGKVTVLELLNEANRMRVKGQVLREQRNERLRRQMEEALSAVGSQQEGSP